MTLRKKITYIVVILLFLVVGLYVISANLTVGASVTTNQGTDINRYKTYDFFTATSTTATSTTDTTNDAVKGLDIKGAKKVTLIFSRGDASGHGNSGSTQFLIEVSPDEGVNWYQYNKLVENVATSTTAINIPSSIILTGTSTSIVSMQNEFDAFSRVRCIARETTDGEHTCLGAVEY